MQGAQSPDYGISHTLDMVYVNEKPLTHPTLGISAASCSFRCSASVRSELLRHLSVFRLIGYAYSFQNFLCRSWNRAEINNILLRACQLNFCRLYLVRFSVTFSVTYLVTSLITFWVTCVHFPPDNCHKLMSRFRALKCHVRLLLHRTDNAPLSP